MSKLFIGLGIVCLLIISISFTQKERVDRNAHLLKLNFQEGDPLSLHPHLGIDLRCRVIERLLFEGLTRVDSKGECQLAAAEAVAISEDQLTYTFTLRPQLWSNGEAVTANHFVQSWKKAIAPDSLCMRTDLFYIIKNAKLAKQGKLPLDEVQVAALDERTLAVTLEHPAPYFLDLLTHPLYSPLYSDEKEPTVFNGPFTIEKWRRDVELNLAANPHYWDKEHVSLTAIAFSFIKDPMTVLSLFEKGEIDFIGDPLTTLPLDTLSSDTYRDRLSYQDVARTYWIYVNTEQFPYNSLKLRKALSYALDRDQLTTHVFQGCLPHKSPVPKNLSLIADDDLYADGEDGDALDLFEEALADLQLTRETLPPLTLSYSTITGQKTLAEAIQQQWSKTFGIDVQIEAFEWSVLASKFNTGSFQMGGCLRSALYNDPLYHLEIFKDKEFPYNAALWENEEYKSLIEQASTATDQQERLAHLRAAEQMLVDEMPVIPVYVDTYKYMTKNKLDGFVIDKSGCIDFSYADF